MEYALQTNCLTKKYRNFQALDNLTMHVPKGSIYGFVGKNGAGKTTLIRIICGLQFETKGEFELYGVKSNDPKIFKTRRRIGAVVETPSIYLDCSARENLRLQYKVLGIPNMKGIDEILKIVGLENTGNKKAKNFSLGMRQRLGIAVALCGNPDFLILDEPINGLDPQGIIEIRELLLKLNHDRNITILISSHILDELSRLATCYGFIDNGKIVREMSAEELEASCRKCMRVSVTDMNVLVRVLDEMGVDYKLIDDKICDIYETVSITKLTLELDKDNCELLTVDNHDESLESFYISLVGGEAK
ncbi:MAG: ATP-binding cassette domain-containing protein [Clostridiales bacterium]|nr:ATP-binding cassette domain-containing protein [Clostridiales bacterium]